MAGAVDISKLFNPRSIAIVGASTREGSAGDAVLRTLETVGFSGAIYPVNPRYDQIRGLPCYPSLLDIPGPVDAAFMAVGAEAAVRAVREAAQVGIRAVEVHAAGFADGGPHGRKLQAELAGIAAEHGIAVCGPNNMGLVNLLDRTGLWPLPPENVGPGPVAIIAQSGSASMVLGEDPNRLGVAYIVTTGNEATLTVSDFLDYVVRDDRVRIVLLFVEAIRDPERFAAVAHEAAARGKTLLGVKVGRSQVAQRAIAAHTDAVANDDRVVDAFLRSCGVVRVRDFDELLETAQLFRAYPIPPRRPGTVVLTMSGGEAALAGDLSAAVGITLAPIRHETRKGLAQDLAAFSLPTNPLDAWGAGWDLERFTLAVERLLREPAVATIVAALDAPASGGCDTHIAVDIADLFARLAPGTDTRFVIVNNSAVFGHAAELTEVCERLGIPCLAGLGPGLAAVAHWESHESPGARTETPQRLAARPLRARVARGELDAAGIACLLESAGIAMVESHLVSSAAEAVRVAERLGYPVVLKGQARNVIHKTDAGLVRLGRGDRTGRAAYAELSARLEKLGAEEPAVTVEPLERGLELVVGARRDPQFGLVTVVGLGGIHVELMAEVSIRVGRVDRTTARAMLAGTLAGRLLDGVRGGPPLDAGAAAHAVAALSGLAASLGDALQSIEVNPLLVRERGQGVVGVDAVLVPSPQP